MDQGAFKRGRRQAIEALSAWQELGYRSYAECQRRLRCMCREELTDAQERLLLAQKPERRDFWLRYIDFLSGYLDGLYERE
jgi:hypothetical protein